MGDARTMYMHTVDGAPAYWHEGDRVIYRAGGRGQHVTLHGSLREIRRHIDVARKTRAAMGYFDPPHTYGYAIVRLPA